MRSVFILVVIASAVRCPAGSTPTTRPAPAERPDVLVLPFSQTAPGNSKTIGAGVQQDLLADLTGHVRGRVLAPSEAPPAADSAAALRASRRLGAAVVVYGNVQVFGDEVRLTGQVIEADTGKALSGLKATGAVEHVFRLEDAIAAQVVAAIPRGLLTPQSLRMVRVDTVPQTFSVGVPAASAYALPSTEIRSGLPFYCLTGLNSSSYFNGYLTPYPPPGPLYGPPRGPVGAAYPNSFYHPFTNNNADLFLFVTINRRR